MLAFGRSLTRHSGPSSLVMAGETGRSERISSTGPSFPGITFTERIVTSVTCEPVGWGLDWAAAEAETRVTTTQQSRTSWGPIRDKTSFPVRSRILKARYHRQWSERSGGERTAGHQDSDRKSYSSITAATATLPAGPPLSTRTTLPLQRTRMLSVSVISGGRIRGNSMLEPAAIAEST